MGITLVEILEMSGDYMDLIPDGWERTIYFDISKLTEEVGELAEALNKKSRTLEDVGDEITDIIGVLGVIALKKGINLEEAIRRKHKKRIQKICNKYHNGKLPEKWKPGFSLDD